MADHLRASDIGYCESVRNVDNMLSQFKKDREYVVSLMNTDLNRLIVDLWTPASPICFDRKCLFNMGNTQQLYTLEERIEGRTIGNEGVLNYYVCPQCKNLKRLIDFDETKIGEPFYIECGSSAGDQLIVTETGINKLYILKESPSPAVARALSNPYISSLRECSAGCNSGDICDARSYSDTNYIGLDSYTNNTLINWYLQSKLNELDMPNVIKMHIAYVCSGKGYCLYEYPDIGRLHHLQEHPEFLSHSQKPSPTAKADDKVPISREVVKGIFMQLFATLHALKQLDFSHGGPSSRSILFNKNAVSYMYDGVHVECPITMKLAGFHHAGITVNSNEESNRFYNKSVIADESLMRMSFKPIINTVTITPFSFTRNNTEEKITIYRLKDPQKNLQETVLFMYIKHLGLPIYQASFDAYAFVIALMADHSFYSAVMNDESMYLLWRKMWLPEEFSQVQDKILKLHESADPVTRVEKILRVLAGFGLRCDMTDYGWNMIKTW